MVAEDRISNLPDTVLQHILSFLSIKNAVASSVLSSRWNQLWTSVPVLHFDSHEWLYEKKPLAYKGFMKFVDRVLDLHDCSNVRNFSLICKAPANHVYLSRLSSWISTAVSKCKVENLNLEVTNLIFETFVFPDCLFKPEPLSTLANLKIDMICVLKVPNAICFSKLECLVLAHITFSSDNLVEQVVFHFPTLKRFCLCDFELVNIKTLTIFAPKLNWLYMSDSLSCTHGCEIKVYAQSLISFLIDSKLSCEYSLDSLLFLVKADVDIQNCRSTVRAIKLLKDICRVKELELTVSDRLFETLGLPDHSAPPFTFQYLTDLKVTAYEYHLMSVRDLISLLHLCLHLEFLHITNEGAVVHEEAWFSCEINEEGWTPTDIPWCLLSHLKSIIFGSFYGNLDQLDVITFLLRNAKVLERITVFVSQGYWAGHDRQVELSEHLQRITRSSTHCTIDIALSESIIHM